MSLKPKDQSPKVVSFPTNLSGLNVAAEQSILWPCLAFSITLPVRKKRDLNVFEETILKITEFETGDTDKISQATCLDKELVLFIQNRLFQLGLLNNRNELTEEGWKILDFWESMSEEHFSHINAIVYVDLLLGKLIPFINTNPRKFEKITRTGKDDYINFNPSLTKEKSKIFARIIRPPDSSHWDKIPTSNEVISVIREFKRRHKQYALLNPDLNIYPPRVPSAEAISIFENSELVYLHCHAFVQKGDSELIVTDGSGLGFSETFAEYLTNQNFKWVIDLKHKGIVDNPTDKRNDKKIEFNQQSKDLHIEMLRESLKKLSQVQIIKVDSTHSELEHNRLISEALVGLYSSIEWALRLVVTNNPVDEWVNLLSGQSHSENKDLLCIFSEKIGFKVSDVAKSLFQVESGKIKAIYYGKAQMQPLLALALAGASNNSNHPLHQLSLVDSGCISFFNTLKKLRDPIAHGHTAKVDLSIQTLEEYCKRTTKIVQTLIPNMTDIDFSTKSGNANEGDQERLKARVDLDKSLGLGFVRTMSPSLREELTKVSILCQKTSLNNDQKQQYVIILASSMQQFLMGVGKDRMFPIENQKSLRDIAIEKIIQSGYYQDSEAIPKQISKVNTTRIKHAVQGLGSTLGAQLLAVFLLATQDELLLLKGSVPNLIGFTADLTERRGHGNEQIVDISNEDIKSLKNDLFKTIKTIEGIIQ